MIGITKMTVVFTDVDDTAYPPQKKAIRMLQYLCQNHINDYAWFVRADDDVYIKVDKLTKLLKSLDYTQKVLLPFPCECYSASSSKHN